MKKIYIIGTSGSGKSYLANILKNKYKIKHFDLDDIFWEKKYTVKREEGEKVKLLSKIIKQNKGWVIEGVFSSFIDEAITKADEVIWLDIHKNILTKRILTRSLKDFKNSNETIKSLYNLIKFARSYKSKEGFYYKHKQKLEQYKIEPTIIKNKKELNKYLNIIFK